jgi:hypothetical protein
MCAISACSGLSHRAFCAFRGDHAQLIVAHPVNPHLAAVIVQSTDAARLILRHCRADFANGEIVRSKERVRWV